MGMGKLYNATKKIQKVQVVKKKKKVKKATKAIVIPRGMKFPLGDRLKLVLRYSDVLNFSSGGAGLLNTRSFNMNSLFDPDQTFIGHQPYGYDQITAMYNRYVVTKCTISLKCVGFGAYNTYVTTWASNGASAPTTASACMEMPNSKTFIVNVGNKATVKSSFDLAAFNGVSRTSYLADDRFEAQFGGSPTELLYWYIGIHNPDGVVSGMSYAIDVNYHAEFYDPKALPQS